MQNKYIDMEALLEEINHAPVTMSVCMNVDECKGRIYERERLIRIIQNAPAADVKPVVLCRLCVLHGTCSTEDVFKFAGLPDDNRFCGAGRRLTNCGAVMEG